MKKTLVIGLLLFLASSANAEQAPRGMARDGRIKVVNYDENNVVKINGHDLIQTSIELHENEYILDVSSGDSAAWQWNIPSGRKNILYLKPMLGDSDTNMKVITNKRIYEFRLVSSEQNKNDDITYTLRFKYPNEDAQKKMAQLKSINESKPKDELPQTRAWNYRYSFSGNKRLKPVKAFDDENAFTYILFRKGSPIPAIYAVDGNRKEQLVNYRIDGPYVVIEKITGQFTLRDGDFVATIINDQYIQREKA